jgi:hypothetical protein
MALTNSPRASTWRRASASSRPSITRWEMTISADKVRVKLHGQRCLARADVGVFAVPPGWPSRPSRMIEFGAWLRALYW